MGIIPAPMQITFPESLPVSARRAELMQAMRAHQVIIVCGETGSGKTTQLPKMALALHQQAQQQAPGQAARARWIGHTQPRRIAASSVAARIAQELQTPLGEVVGYKVRFSDRVSGNTAIKLMTDGILLAETQTDPLLQAYHTLIIDEAHERSLNIDFLLGYLKQILPRRPDLKLIITSATIDAQRFGTHFGGAPLLQVSGRSYPVEIRWRPFQEPNREKDKDLNEAIADGVDELWGGGQNTRGGDILVFLPGEREIREAAEHLRKHLAQHAALRDAEILPLFARLSQGEQQRIFAAHARRRIVLATNVAETSLTVPGIHYVIDAGTARVKRYAVRSKVEQLLVEPVSQAAAQQRAGRCGRVASGICLRLYGEDDFKQRPAFGDPEILRSSLAAVMLRMKALGLGEAAAFPFLDAPSSRAIADGQQLLLELGAVDEGGALTPMGQTLARLPLDPRVARMIVEAARRGALAEVLVIAAALSVSDVRERPLHAQQQADQQHAKFDDDKSEFNSYLRLWRWLHDARGGKAASAAAATPKPGKSTIKNAAFLPAAQRSAPAQPAPQEESGAGTHKLSNRQWEHVLRQHFISPRRVREWRDTHSQLLTVAREQRWAVNTAPAGDAALHQSLLAGLLGNIGWRGEESEDWLGARGIRFRPHPGARLRKKPARWLMAAELVQTTRLYARAIAAIEPQWLEEVGVHLLKKHWLDPHWSKNQGDVLAAERATLHGLVVYSGRRISYGRKDPQTARDVFIRQALVQGQWETHWPFLAANHKTVRHIEEMEHKSRRQDVLVDEELIYAFYERHIPQDVYNAASFDAWYRDARRAVPDLLHITREALMRHAAASITAQAFPQTVKLGGADCSASYLHRPGDARDGITVTVPLFVLNQISSQRVQWLVPGMLQEKIHALLKSLPQRARARLLPLAASAQRMAQTLAAPEHWAQGDLLDAVLQQAREISGLPLQAGDFKLETLAPHLFMNLLVTGEHGRQLAQGRNLAALQAGLGAQARGAFQALSALKIADGAKKETKSNIKISENEKIKASQAIENNKIDSQTRYRDWDFGELPEILEIHQNGQTLTGFPALIDQGDAVCIEVFDQPQRARHRAGLRRLLALQLREALKYLEKNIPDLQKMAVAYLPLGTLEQLRQQIIDAALERAFLQDPLPGNAESFRQRLAAGRARLNLIAGEIARLAATILPEYSAVQRKLKDSRFLAAEAVQDIQQQLQRLMPAAFIRQTPWAQLQHYPRYLKAIAARLDKYRADPARDSARMAEVRALERRCWQLIAQRKGQSDARLQECRWMLEEWRVGLFAQELRTAYPVSGKRIERVFHSLCA